MSINDYPECMHTDISNNVQVSCNYSGCTGCCPICNPPRCPCCGRRLSSPYYYELWPWYPYQPYPWQPGPYWQVDPWTISGNTSALNGITYTTYKSNG